MRAHCFLHVPFEGIGSIEPWLVRNGYEITCTRFYNTVESPELLELPDPSSIELLVIMGGPMSVNDEHQFPWLVAEKAFVRKAVDSGMPVLGVCLGAQIIANAMGAEVFPNLHKEIGWFPVHAAPVSHIDTPARAHTKSASTRAPGIPDVKDSIFSFPPSATVFHWHGETFGLPTGAVLLASSSASTNQAFQLGKRVIGLQFHLETTPDSARDIVENCRGELRPAEYVQPEADILSATAEQYRSINTLMSDILSFLLRSS